MLVERVTHTAKKKLLRLSRKIKPTVYMKPSPQWLNIVLRTRLRLLAGWLLVCGTHILFFDSEPVSVVSDLYVRWLTS